MTCLGWTGSPGPVCQGAWPVVLTNAEVALIFVRLPLGSQQLAAGLLYGSGLRLMEAMRLRVKDVDSARCVRQCRVPGVAHE